MLPNSSYNRSMTGLRILPPGLVILFLNLPCQGVDNLKSDPQDTHKQMVNVDGIHSTLTSDSAGLLIGHNREAVATTQSINARSTPGPIATSQRSRKLNVQEDQLAEASNKVAITHSLVKSYHDSLESSLVLWITEDNCPYNLKEDHLRFAKHLKFNTKPLQLHQ